jgi:hypothetical protein
MQLERTEELLRNANQMIESDRKGVQGFIEVAVKNIDKNSFRADFYLHLLRSFLLDSIHEDLTTLTEDQCIMFIPHEVKQDPC